MECGESILCGSGELDLDPDIVSEEAGKLYSELQTVIETHGVGVVESLVPILVWVLEGLASCRAQLREREEEAEREKGERDELLERYQSEKLLRRESQERYLELDDQIEQERRTMRGREKERERREKELEKKAREQADQLVALEEQRAGLGRELNTLKHTHNKLVVSYKDLLERKRDIEGSPLSNHVRSKNSQSTQGQSESCVSGQELTDQRPETPPDSVLLEEPVIKDDRVIDIVVMPDRDASFINDIISSTPELVKFHGLMKASTPVRADAKETIGDETKTSMEEEIKKEEGGAKQEKEEEEEEDMHSLEWELRNTESVFSELSELSQEYIESVDQGASVRGSTDQFEEILSQYEELKHTHELVNAARKALISRVEELTNERSALKVEVTSCQETVTRLEGRMKEMEEETKRLRKELESNKSDDSSLTISLRRFSRSEMSRVVMEKNQYKERLFELQEAVRRSQAIRATQEERITERERTSVWRRFNRLFGLNKNPLVPSAALALTLPTSPSLTHSPMGSPRQLAVSTTQTDGASPAAALSPRVRRRELYREIRSHVWGTLGKRQVHGWSMPLSHTQDSSDPTPEPKDVPVLVQLRLLDQRDSTAKLNCAVAVTPEISGETTCAVWVVSGPASSSDVTVINPARSNTVLDQFSLPPTSPALCICAVPPTGETSGTVWIGTQEGSVLVHSASTARRRCLQSISLSEGVHSLTYSLGQVIAGLANGTLAFFSHNPGGWDLQSHEVLPLGSSPLQPIRCCLAKGAGLWVGYWNRVHVVDVENRKVEQTLTVSERSEQQVRFLCAAGSGVWTSCRLDPTLRLFDWSTGRPLQDVDLTPLVTKTLGPAFLSLSPLQISSLIVISGRLWVGTGSGAIFSIPVSLSSESASIPYCSLAAAQLCYHGHRQAVKFIIAAPGCVTSSSTIGGGAVTLVSTSQLILSGGEGYINFRIGDDANDGAPEAAPLRSDRSHMIIWQSPTPSLPSSAL
ncbi:C-Jun-amino-terminal kinase-interacting protein 4 isoform X1 [Salvelinus namaycush]|uniref:C-Jun-amino-terminal kinase-interacting protein 4 isoform X1 n=1 Tax=Salvelinus namaycush TaxID=8040 RepID=A0A8U0QUE4_SALNM|nr:C-Jun-amino-terminal kinase-interacting protein 4 isoform X1 [Salvelinus namaycush]XP_038850765.1 C-Jun-amino-terminal kinase-interacting protein 4 isoform X1 [Salvelinus namaycush]XP_038850766.1 C-Jun-amino-terminal kinase-interacting protein 4 isoform X1 [Salvelinus namaycush]